MTFSIIIPTRNERNNLESLLPVLMNLYPVSPVWIVDDNSDDQTAEFIQKNSGKFPGVHLILRINKRGRGSAVLDGLKEAIIDKKTEYFLEMDADFSHDPDEIKKILKEGLKTPRGLTTVKTPQGRPKDSPGVEESKSVIIGSRHIEGSKFVNCSTLRVFLSILANLYAKLILRVPISDYTNGFRLYPRRAVEILLHEKISEKGYIFLSETAYILYRKGFEFREVPTIFVNRRLGRSNATIAEFLKSIPAIIRIRMRH